MEGWLCSRGAGKEWHLGGFCWSCGSVSQHTWLPGLSAIPAVIPDVLGLYHIPSVPRFPHLQQLIDYPVQRASSFGVDKEHLPHVCLRGEVLGVIIWECATAKPPSFLLGGSENFGFDGRRALFPPPATSWCGQMMVSLSLCRVFALGCQGSVLYVLWVPNSFPFPAENYLEWGIGAAG